MPSLAGPASQGSVARLAAEHSLDLDISTARGLVSSLGMALISSGEEHTVGRDPDEAG